MRKLVLLTNRYGALTEVDPKALRREALALKTCIESAPRKEEKQFQYRQKLLPLVEAALNGTLQIPLKGDGPYPVRWMEEGFEPWLPEPLSEMYFTFLGRVRGVAHLSAPSYLKTHDIMDYVPEIVEKDGQRYEWVEFED